MVFVLNVFFPSAVERSRSVFRSLSFGPLAQTLAACIGSAGAACINSACAVSLSSTDVADLVDLPLLVVAMLTCQCLRS